MGLTDSELLGGSSYWSLDIFFYQIKNMMLIYSNIILLRISVKESGWKEIHHFKRYMIWLSILMKKYKKKHQKGHFHQRGLIIPINSLCCDLVKKVSYASQPRKVIWSHIQRNRHISENVKILTAMHNNKKAAPFGEI